MKCALCGDEWADRPPYEKLLTHPQNGCCLSPVADITETEVTAINAAIRQARAEGKEKQTFEKWFQQLVAYAKSKNMDGLIAENSSESYREMYDDGLTPEDALYEEASAL